MRFLYVIIFIGLCYSCSEEIVFVEDANAAKVELYFNNLQYLKYPVELKEHTLENNIRLVYFLQGRPLFSPTTAIITIIDKYKKEMANYQDAFMVKDWWIPLPNILIHTNNASSANSIAFETGVAANQFTNTNYFQFTKTPTKLYYMPIKEYKSAHSYSFQVEEIIWQSTDMSKGEINNYNKNIKWETTTDSLIIEESLNGASYELRLHKQNLVGKIKYTWLDSLGTFTWDNLGHGNYIKTHVVTGESNKKKLIW